LTTYNDVCIDVFQDILGSFISFMKTWLNGYEECSQITNYVSYLGTEMGNTSTRFL